MEENYWHLGRWRRIPVSMHWTVLISFVWLYLFLWDLVATAIASVAFFGLLVIHELGHVLILRKRKISIEKIELFGIHGKTSHGWASASDEMFVAWGGIGAQGVVLLTALVAGYLLGGTAGSIVSIIAVPTLFVFTKLNIVLMIVALLPIGPFDGRSAWTIIPWMRKKLRRRRATKVQMFPEETLSPEKRRELEESSSRVAADLMARLGRKDADRAEDL